MEALGSACQDTNLDVQGAVVSVVTGHFPFEDPPCDEAHMTVLLEAILPMILHNEDAISQQLFVWFHPGGDGSRSKEWIDRHVAPLIVATMSKMFKQAPASQQSASTFRLLRSLFGKAEFKTAIERGSLIPALESAKRIASSESSIGSPVKRDLAKQAALTVKEVDLAMAWGIISEHLKSEVYTWLNDGNHPPEGEDDGFYEALSLMEWCLNYEPLNPRSHLMKTLPHLIVLIDIILSNAEALLTRSIKHCVVAMRFTCAVSSLLHPDERDEGGLVTLATSGGELIVAFVERLVGDWAATGNTFECEYCHQLFHTFGEAQLHEDTCERRECPSPSPSPEGKSKGPGTASRAQLECLGHATTLTIKLEEVAAPSAKAQGLLCMVDEEPGWLRAVLACARSTQRGVAVTGIRALIGLLNAEMTSIAKVTQSRLLKGGVVAQVAGQLWEWIGEENQASPLLYEAAQLLALLEPLAPRLCGDIVALSLVSGDSNLRVVSHKKFNHLWQLLGRIVPQQRLFGRPLMLALDALDDDSAVLRMEASAWAITSLRQVDRVLDPLVEELMEYIPAPVAKAQKGRGGPAPTTPTRVGSPILDDHDRIQYLLVRITALVRCDQRLFVQHAAGLPLSSALNALTQKCTTDAGGDAMGGWLKAVVVQDYIDLLLVATLRLTEEQQVMRSLIASAAYELVAAIITALGSSSARLAQRASQISESILGPVLIRLEMLLKNEVPKAKGWAGVAVNILSKAADRAMRIQEELTSTPGLQSVVQVQMLNLLFCLVRHHGPGWREKRDIHKQLGNVVRLGISASPDQNASLARSYWVSFVCNSMPYTKNALGGLVEVSLSTMCGVIESEYKKMSASGELTHSFSSELGFLLDGISQIISFCTLDSERNVASPEKGAGLQEPMRMFTDFVKDVFIPDAATSPMSGETEALAHSAEAQIAVFRQLPSILRALVMVWGTRQARKAGANESGISHELHIATQVHVATFAQANRRAVQELLDPLIIHYPTELVASFAAVWGSTDAGGNDSIPTRELLMEMVNAVDPNSPDAVIGACLDLYLWQAKDSRKKGGVAPKAPGVGRIPEKMREAGLLHFLEMYIQNCALDGDSLGEAWPSMQTLIKEGLASRPNSQATPLLLLRILDKYMRRGPNLQTPQHRKQLQEIGTTLLTAVLKVVGKPLEIVEEGDARGLVFTPGIADMHDVGNGSDAGRIGELRRADPAGYARLRGVGATVSLKALDGIANIAPGLLCRIFPEEKDKDKIAAVLQSILPPVIGFVRNHSPTNLPYSNKAIDMLVLLSETQDMVKSWTKTVWELFHEPEFFLIDIAGLRKWRHLVGVMMMQSDGTPLQELLHGKVQHTTMFSSREQDAAQRARLLKRLSFAIFSGGQDAYAPHVPVIFEKLVESLKMGTRNILLQVFLTLRVMIVRISAEHLTPLWPLVVTELDKSFVSPSTDAMLTLSALKFLDLCLVLNVDGFQLFRWKFLGGVLETGGQATFEPVAATFASNPLEEEASIRFHERGEKRRPVVLLHSTNNFAQVSSYARLLLNRADDAALKAAKPDLSFVDFILELEMIEYRVDTRGLAKKQDDSSHGIHENLDPVTKREREFRVRFGEPFAGDWKIVMDDCSGELPGGAQAS